MINSTDVRVDMRAGQSMGTESDKQERSCMGKRYERDGAMIVKYRDTESDTVDTLEITGRRVKMKRSGSVRSEMDFAPGESHIFEMETTLGSFTFLVRTKRVAVGIYPDLITVELAYDLYADGSLVSHNHVDYRIKSESAT